MESAECAVCGKQFEYPITSGRKRLYCSVKCADKAHNERSDKSYWKRKSEDPEWVEKRREYNRNRYRALRDNTRVERLTKIAESVRSAETLEEAVDILLENAQLRAKF